MEGDHARQLLPEGATHQAGGGEGGGGEDGHLTRAHEEHAEAGLGSMRTTKSVGFALEERRSSLQGAVVDPKSKEERRNMLLQRVGTTEHVGPQKKRILAQDAVFDAEDPQVKEDIIGMIIQYLQDNDYTASSLTLQDETNVKLSEKLHDRSHFKDIRRAITEGDWAEVEKLCTKQTFRNHKSFLYAVHKQQYLELLEKQEFQKAFTFLNKRLKPYERYATNPKEFRDLCYLLTCKSVQDAPSFKNWDGAKGTSREKLVEQFQSMLQFETRRTASGPQVPPNRLLALLRQAVFYQLEFSRYHPKVVPKVTTLLEDFSPFVLPNALKDCFVGHRGNVKCVEFIGEEGFTLASGSSDNTIKVWDVEAGAGQKHLLHTLKGHTSRIWDISSNLSGSLLASASGDGSVKLWDLSRQVVVNSKTLKSHKGDVYSVKFHPGENHVVTGGYDKIVRLFDVRTGTLIKTFTGHQASVSKVIFNPHGNLIISGSKDNTIKFWDMTSGLCVKTYSTYLGEVTSVATNMSGSLLLSASKDNSNRLWDVRTARPVRRFKGHQNTSKNFVRAAFGPNESLIIGGSEDGCIYLWDQETGDLLQKLRGHSGVVYEAIWNAQQSLVASCGEDETVRTWWYDERQPLFADENQEGLVSFKPTNTNSNGSSADKEK
ncbi:WD40 repeat-containing protein SMU1 [Balamuthia mandrillaris]